MAHLPEENSPTEYQESTMLQPARPPRSLPLRTRKRLRAVRAHEQVAEDRRTEAPPADPYSQGWSEMRTQKHTEERREDVRGFLAILAVAGLLGLILRQIVLRW